MVNPYNHSNLGKKEQVAEMFNAIAPKYDFLNHWLSFGIDKLWRKKAVRLLSPFSPKNILDVATGTGDFAVEVNKLKPEHIIGMDISEGMMKIAEEKISNLGLQETISFEVGDSEAMRFSTESMDAITVGFGVRNFEHLEIGLSEFYRVLKAGGVACVLEFSKPRAFPVKQLYNFYSYYVLPWWGRIVSKDKRAYTYLPESVAAFPDGEDFIAILNKVGFHNVKEYRLTFGIATIYLAVK
ncbi:bifunctional demethylmenaquinone methyltransferase/2-methoxy-6-polyprenyl-1,4-benzoquinol methylase UbiE [Halosquirtibacter laminarini]|uniref:Bifunctional demethylmenaquinone methyltransferase/2-methoxy-6-polyprenyl-1,4-benzoquinol methylase UbiE n=1 Tax=Halosquirtibacter laminarini TaxID=3374600 RepID=A0AC61NP12_9BACT|nr:bifunctional demethylmenaquinone methyltransferase/2-methoxy-6-polyprenyl-1,4-benzoquinol methylase UbiE [Prolixibacteraceae bacterium]